MYYIATTPHCRRNLKYIIHCYIGIVWYVSKSNSFLVKVTKAEETDTDLVNESNVLIGQGLEITCEFNVDDAECDVGSKKYQIGTAGVATAYTGMKTSNEICSLICHVW